MAVRKKTRQEGVLTTQSARRRHMGKPDVGYVIDYVDADGKRHRQLVGWASDGMTVAAAAEVRRQVMARVRSERATLPELRQHVQQELTLLHAWHRYRDDWLHAQGKSSQTDATRMRSLLTPLHTLPLSAITPLDLDRIMTDMRAKGLAPQTIRAAIGLVRRIMRRMQVWGLYSGPMPYRQITLPTVDNRRERYLTPQEAQALLAALKPRSHTLWAMSLISLHCGMRFGEIAALRWRDIRPADGLIYIAQSKSGRARHAVMTPDVRAALEAMRGLVPSGPDDLIFPARDGGPIRNAGVTFFRVVDALGLNGSPDAPVTDRRQRVVFHTLRHTYASWLALAGERELSLAELLGHSSTAMTRRYTHLMDEARRASADKITALFHSVPPCPRSDPR